LDNLLADQECDVSKRFAIKPAIFAAALVFGLSGCAHYQPVPLTHDSIEQALSSPTPAELQEQVKDLQHPLLKPLALDIEDGIAPDEAAVLAVLLNPSLRVARDQKALAAAQVLQAKLLPNPELSSDLENPVGGNTSEATTGFGLGLSWDIASLITQNARIQAATENENSIDLDIAWQEWQVAQAAKETTYRLIRLENQVKLTEEDRSVLERNLESVQRAVNEGVKTIKDLSAARAAYQQTDGSLLDLRKQASEQRLKLKQLMGLSPESEIHLQEGIELPSHFDPPPAESMSNGLEQRRLDLVALRHGYESQEAAVRAAVLNQFPKISFGPTFSRDVENIDSAGFGISIQLPFFDRNQAKIAAERATRQKLFDEYVSRIFESRSAIAVLVDRIHFLDKQIAAAQAAENNMQRLMETYHEAAVSGRADILTYYSVRTDWTAARLKTVQLKEQLAEAMIALELASGMYQVSDINKIETE
jgi:cobalt-zinc-cadmium efflux system outer membrane protein